jgi:hypothetical protein
MAPQRGRLASASEPARKRIRVLDIERVKNEQWLARIYDEVGAGSLSVECTLGDHVAARQKRIKAIEEERNIIERTSRLPIFKFSDQNIDSFVEHMKSALCEPSSPLAKAYLHSVVSDIQIRVGGGSIRGSRLQLANSVSQIRELRPNAPVPSHVSDWCPRPDSNQHAITDNRF